MPIIIGYVVVILTELEFKRTSGAVFAGGAVAPSDRHSPLRTCVQRYQPINYTTQTQWIQESNWTIELLCNAYQHMFR